MSLSTVNSLFKKNTVPQRPSALKTVQEVPKAASSVKKARAPKKAGVRFGAFSKDKLRKLIIAGGPSSVQGSTLVYFRDFMEALVPNLVDFSALQTFQKGKRFVKGKHITQFVAFKGLRELQLFPLPDTRKRAPKKAGSGSDKDE